MALSAREDAINWPDEPRFVYRRSVVLGSRVLGWFMTGQGLALLSIAVLVSAANRTSWDHRGFGALALVLLAAVPFLGFGLFYALVGLPAFAITADGVFAWRRGKAWRAIAWGDAASITRSYFRARSGQLVPRLVIKGRRAVLRIDKGLDRYDEVRRLLTRYAHDHGITLREVRGNTTSVISEI